MGWDGAGWGVGRVGKFGWVDGGSSRAERREVASSRTAASRTGRHWANTKPGARHGTSGAEGNEMGRDDSGGWWIEIGDNFKLQMLFEA